MKTIKTIFATLALFLTISEMSAQALIVVKKGNLITVTDKATRTVLCNQPATPTSSIPAISFEGTYIVVDGLNVNAYNSTCVSTGRLTMAPGSLVGAPTLENAIFSVTSNGNVKNYNSACRAMD